MNVPFGKFQFSEGEARPTWWIWMIAVAASLGAILEVIDTSIVNVALNDMQGNLGATLSEVGWVVTGYAIANVVIIPLSAWLGDYFGKKRYFIFSLIGFTIASVLCGCATSLSMLVISRIIQGLAGGGLLAKAQAILFETFPKEKQGMAQAVFGLGVIAGPAFGPTLGGYLTDNYGWRWIFFINIPFGILAVFMAWVFFYPDKHNPNFNRRIDWFGILFLIVGLASFQTMLEEGQQYDWFSSRFILTMAVCSVVFMTLFIWQELTIDYPAVNLRVLRYRSLAAGSVFSMVLGLGLYGALFAIPIFTQSLLNFSAVQTGLLLMPGALASAFGMIVSGQLIKWVDARILIGLGALVMAATMFYLAQINPQTGVDNLYWPLIWRGLGTVLMYLPLSLATFAPIPKKDVAAASGFYNLTRQIGGSVGIAILTTLLAQRENFHRSNLSQQINAYRPIVRQNLSDFAAAAQAHGTAPTVAKMQAYGLMDRTLDTQAAVFSFGDLFWAVGVVFISTLVLLFFLGKPSKSTPVIDAH